MYRPPAISREIGPARCPVLVLIALALLGGLLCVVFWTKQTQVPAGICLGLTFLACTLLFLHALRKPVRGRLHWDGEWWHWSGQDEGAVTELVCVMDLQRCMLLRVRCCQMTVWLWLEADAMDARWLAMRRAILASQALADGDDANNLRG
jgi:hypothetical protein